MFVYQNFQNLSKNTKITNLNKIMKKFLILSIAAITLSSCNWTLELSDATQTMKTTISIVPVEEYEK